MAALRTWIDACRPKTLVAAAVPVAVGGAVIWAYGEEVNGLSLCLVLAYCLAFALCVQVACNFANDLGDSYTGADTAGRVGPRRAVSAGDISPAAMRRGIWIACLLALLLGGAASGVAATEGNLNNHLGVPLTLTRLDPARHRVAVVEAGINTPGEMDALAAMIEPDLAIITMIGAAHIEALGGLEGVAREKSRLPAATRPPGFALFTLETAAFGPFAALGGRKLVLERADVVRPAEPPPDRAYFAVTQREGETVLAIAVGPPPPLAFTMPRVSEGMAQNAALAICAAWRMGVPRGELQARLATWRPGALRGEVRRSGERLLYVDCYNANPASMADALAAFHGLASAAEPRLYVLGGMEELGAQAPRHHRALGRSLALRPDDRVLVTGPFASEVLAGLRDAGAPSGQACEIPDAAAAGPAVAGWRGAVFVKGSRRYRLEEALAAAGEEVAGHA